MILVIVQGRGGGEPGASRRGDLRTLHNALLHGLLYICTVITLLHYYIINTDIITLFIITLLHYYYYYYYIV